MTENADCRSLLSK